MRVLYVESNEDHTVGGSHQALFDLVCRLDRARYEPVVLFYQDNIFVERLRQAQVAVRIYEDEREHERATYGAPTRWRRVMARVEAVMRRVQLLRRERIDLVHLNNAPSVGHTTWLPAARLAGARCVVTAMGTPAPERGAIKRRLARSYDQIIPISRYMSNVLSSEGVPLSRQTLVYLGIDVADVQKRVSRDAAEARAELGIDGGTVLTAMVGNIRHWKGQHVVLEALQLVPADIRGRLHILFIGAAIPGDPYLEQLKATVDRHGLDGTVTFLGTRRDVPDLLNACDIALHASVEPEPFGLVVPEAMALGKPVIAANTGGPAEVLTDESGVTFDPRKPDELATHLTALARDPDYRARLGAAARTRVVDFDVSRNVAGVESVYAKLFQLPNGRGQPT